LPILMIVSARQPFQLGFLAGFIGTKVGHPKTLGNLRNRCFGSPWRDGNVGKSGLRMSAPSLRIPGVPSSGSRHGNSSARHTARRSRGRALLDRATWAFGMAAYRSSRVYERNRGCVGTVCAFLDYITLADFHGPAFPTIGRGDALLDGLNGLQPLGDRTAADTTPHPGRHNLCPARCFGLNCRLCLRRITPGGEAESPCPDPAGRQVQHSAALPVLCFVSPARSPFSCRQFFLRGRAKACGLD
jgi:hypothetical protein